jgi:DNA (cytosine-5)-methyltransferase 1
MKPKLLDLFCGAGGATKGLQHAGFYVVGVDIKKQPHYCGDEFYQADALEFPPEGYDAYWASPPCQSYSISQYMQGVKGAGKYIDDVRDTLAKIQKPFVIENVPGAPLIQPIELSGMSFGLKIIRRRLFELHGFDVLLIPSPHQVNNYRAEGYLPYHHGTSIKRGHLPNIWTKPRLQAAMGINWMDVKEMTQAIPPAYSEFLGKEMIKYCGSEK